MELVYLTNDKHFERYGLLDNYIRPQFIIFRQNTPCLSRLGMNGGHLSEQSKKVFFAK
jgi:hypothetical protein